VSALDLFGFDPLCIAKYDPYQVRAPLEDSFGQPVQDAYDPSKLLMSPTSDFGSVVSAGQGFGAAFSSTSDPFVVAATAVLDLGRNLSQGGELDY
jgi:hypothetical protein